MIVSVKNPEMPREWFCMLGRWLWCHTLQMVAHTHCGGLVEVVTSFAVCLLVMMQHGSRYKYGFYWKQLMSHAQDESCQQLVQRLWTVDQQSMAMQAPALVNSLHISLYYGRVLRATEFFSFVFPLVFLVWFARMKRIAHARLRAILF
jgi:hypothetical protein